MYENRNQNLQNGLALAGALVFLLTLMFASSAVLA